MMLQTIGFSFNGINFVNSSFHGFSLNAYAEEQVCQITTKIAPPLTKAEITEFRIAILPPVWPQPPPDGRVVDLSDDLEVVVEAQPNVRIVEK
jgi:hypothetical protein